MEGNPLQKDIKSLNIFGDLPEVVQGKLTEHIITRTFKEGEMIFLQGDPANAIYLVSAGRIKISRVTEDGNEIILGGGVCISH